MPCPVSHPQSTLQIEHTNPKPNTDTARTHAAHAHIDGAHHAAHAHTQVTLCSHTHTSQRESFPYAVTLGDLSLKCTPAPIFLSRTLIASARYLHSSLSREPLVSLYQPPP